MNIYVYYHIRFKSGLANNIYIHIYDIYYLSGIFQYEI